MFEFEFGSAPVRAFTAGAMVVALAACGSEVNVAATGTGGGSSTSSASNGGASASSTASGGGGGGGLPAPVCQMNEAAIVAAIGEHGVVAFNQEGTWTENAYLIPAAAQVTTYEEAYHQLGVFWTETTQDSPQSHFATTWEGNGFELHDVHGWDPLSSSPLVTVAPSLLLGSTSEGSTLAIFAGSSDWHPVSKGGAPFVVTSAVALGGGSVSVFGVGVGPQHQLCDVDIYWLETGWMNLHCRDELKVFTGNEILVAPPRVVVLPSGDLVVVYHESYTTIAATRLHAGSWSAPESITLAGQSLDVAITATPGGDVIAAVPATSGLVSAVRYVPGVGWGTPLPIEQMSDPVAAISAAPGICGDDAMIAYVASSLHADVRVARVRGGAVEARTVASFTQGIPRQISLTTRPMFLL